MGGKERRHPQLQSDLFSNSPAQSAPSIPVRSVDLEQTIDNNSSIRQSRRYANALTPLARLVFYVLLDRIAIFVVNTDGKVAGYVSPIGCDELEQKVARLRRTLQVDEAARGLDRKFLAIPDDLPDLPLASAETLLQEFYRDLVAPIADALPAEGNILAIEPHASLWLVPFAALQLPDRTWMSDRWSLVYSPSARTLTEIRSETCYDSLDRSRVLIVGNPLMPKLTLSDGREIDLEPLSGANRYARTATVDIRPDDSRWRCR